MRRTVPVLWAVLALALAGCGHERKPTKIGFMPKLVGIPYFNACKKGAEEAAAELGRELVYNGPSTDDANAQITLLQQWVDSGEYLAICVACNNPDLLAPVLGDARKKGITVVTYDADTHADDRDRFVNMCTYDSVARAMIDDMAGQLGPPGEGKVALLTSSVHAPNQAEWAKRMKEYAAQKYPRMQLLPETEHGEDRDLGTRRAAALIGTHPDLKGIIGLTSVAVPAAADAVRKAVAAGNLKPGQVKVGGVTTPRDVRDFVADGTIRSFILWSPVDLGYLAVQVADKLLKKELTGPMTETPPMGRLGPKQVGPHREIVLGEPIRFTKENIDGYDF
jgi:ABC-type sugar transport system substrate-binding protein